MTIVDKLRTKAAEKPDQIIFNFLEPDISVSKSLSYKKLLDKSNILAGYIQKHVKPNERILLMLSDRQDFIVAFISTILCGNIAVPLPQPRKKGKDIRAYSVIKDCTPKLIIGNKKVFNSSKKNNPELHKLNWLFIEEVEDTLSNYDLVSLTPAHDALIQYTSGSTGTPKGVILNHANITANSEIIKSKMKLTKHDRHVSWLPQFHDMGLFGSIITPLVYEIETWFLSPIDFVRKPIRWLQAISKFSASVSGGPNFSFDLCLEKIDAHDTLLDLDLSQWRVAYCGSETINPNTLARFNEKFYRFGFDSKSYFPCYGLAEATLMISSVNCFSGYNTLKSEESTDRFMTTSPHNLKEVVCCGESGEEGTIKIVANNEECEEGLIGEIYYKGPNVASGYWGQSDQNARTFNQLVGKEEGYLNTGDLGFISKGSLYVTGRTKELIIKNGQNYYASDIQSIVSTSHKSLIREGCLALSYVKKGGEELAIIQEIKRTTTADEIRYQAIAAAIYKKLSSILNIQPDIVILVAERHLSRTTSGKLRREQGEVIVQEDKSVGVLYRCGFSSSEKPAYEGKTNDSRNQLELTLLRIIGKYVPAGVKPPSLDDSPFELGIDSISAVDLTVNIENSLNISLDPSLLWEFKTIGEIVDFIDGNKFN